MGILRTNVYVFNPDNQEAEAEDYGFKASLGSIVRLFLIIINTCLNSTMKPITLYANDK